MANFFLILVYLAIGQALRWVPKFSAETPNVLNAFVLYVALPALILQKIPNLTFSAALLVPALMPWLLLICVVGLVLVASRLWRWDRETTAALLIVLPLGNTSFLGFPMVEAFFGADALPYAMIYDQLGSFVALATYSTILAALYGQSTAKPTVRAIAWRILSFPPFLAAVVALLCKGFTYPPFFDLVLTNLAQTLVPLIMAAVGFQLRFSLADERLSRLVFGLAVKLLVMPGLAWVGCLALGLQGAVVQVSVFEAAMPPMVTAGMLAMMAGLAPRLVASLVGFGLLLSFVTLPAWYWLVNQTL